MKKLFCHIGFEKCASTTIQSTLQLAYPAYKYRLNSLNDYTETNIFDLININLNEDFILISDERLSWGIDLTNDIVNIIIKVASELGLEFKILIVYRNYFEYLVSLYSESLKWGGVLNFIDFCRKSTNAQPYDTRIRSLGVNRCNINLIKLDAMVVSNFFSLLGLVDINNAAADQNVRISSGVSKLLYEYNLENISLTEDIRISLCRSLINSLPEHFIKNFHKTEIFPIIDNINFLEIENLIGPDCPITLESLTLKK